MLLAQSIRLIADSVSGGQVHRRSTAWSLFAIVAGLVIAAVLVVAFFALGGLPFAPSETAVVEPPPAPKPYAVAERRVARPEPPPLEVFDVDNAIAELRAIEAFGVRQGGASAETSAAAYIAGRLADLGYSPRIDEFPIVAYRTSRNVVARSEGRSDLVLVVGAHMDSKPPSPGANDNASGCGVLLEVARILASQPVTATVEFVFFGTEEIVGGPGEHHFGSRYYVDQMTDEERARTAGMISVDMIGVGDRLHSRTMLRGPQSLSDFILGRAEELDIEMTFLKDPGRTGWSDHAPFEMAGIPAAAIHRLPDSAYHTFRDTSERIEVDAVDEVGMLVLDVIRALDRDKLALLEQEGR